MNLTARCFRCPRMCITPKSGDAPSYTSMCPVLTCSLSRMYNFTLWKRVAVFGAAFAAPGDVAEQPFAQQLQWLHLIQCGQVWV